jgi:dTDP-4-dehydrorhamnose 3,5-epimerase
MSEQPSTITGGNFIDDRGILQYLNSLEGFVVKRMYVICNHKKEYIRAWHGHKKEEKIFIPISGSFLIGAVPIDDFENPNSRISPIKKILSDHLMEGFKIPAGYANGIMNLTENAKLLVLSNSTLEESKEDDYRFDWDVWDIWKITNR